MKKRNFKIILAYDGTAYSGWQLQKNAATVQGEVEKALLKAFGHRHRLYASSRTDAGVHARAQTANFKTSVNIPAGKIPQALNSLLPGDIAVTSAAEVPTEFHSQFDAVEKHYKYYIYTSRTRDPFRERYSWRVGYPLNMQNMRRSCSVLKGEHDFRAFQAKDKRDRSSVRTINFLRVSSKKKDKIIVIDIKANGFLYNMVRNITGTLVDIGRGYLSPDSMRSILQSRDRKKAGPTAPPEGLFLHHVTYGPCHSAEARTI
jgi:tRNA pseudouridine38-40 synthase